MSEKLAIKDEIYGHIYLDPEDTFAQSGIVESSSLTTFCRWYSAGGGTGLANREDVTMEEAGYRRNVEVMSEGESNCVGRGNLLSKLRAGFIRLLCSVRDGRR